MIYTQISDELSFKDIEASLDYDIKSYNIIQPLGQGANGFVCKIEDFKSKECYAMKVVDKKRKDISNVMKRLDQEIKIQKELDHPNIIRLYKHFEDEQNHYLIMELAKNGEIKDYLNHYKPLNENQILDFSYQLACGIKYLHDKDIVHRDLKLNNVLLSNGIIKIADFGLATKVTDENPECNTMCGTANYLSPEILNSKGYGKKTDVWSFGCILYALCSGNLPFFSGNPSKTIQNIKEGKWSLPNNVSDSVKDLLQNTLNWDQNSRYSIEQVLKHKFYDKKHRQSMIIFNTTNEGGSNQINKLSTPTKTLLDWTSPRFNMPIHIQQKSQSSQKKNKKMNTLKNQKSMTSIKLDLSECNKENQSNLSNTNNHANKLNANQQKVVSQTKLQKQQKEFLSQQLQQSNQQNSMGMSNLFLTTARSINLADNSIIISALQDTSINKQTTSTSKPTQKLQNYFQQNSTPQQQLKQSSIQNQQQQLSSSTNMRNKFDQSNNSTLLQNKSQQSLLNTNTQKPLSQIPNHQSEQNQNKQNSLSQHQFSQSQNKSNKEQTPIQFNPYMSQNNEKNHPEQVNNAFKSYRSTSSLHQNISTTNQSQTYRDPLQLSQLTKANSQQPEKQDLSKLPLHNIKKPLQYFSQQQQQMVKDGENSAFTQSQSNHRQNNGQGRGDSANNAAMKYSSLSTVSKPYNKQDESFIHNYQQPRINSQLLQQKDQRDKSSSKQIPNNENIKQTPPQNLERNIPIQNNINQNQYNSSIKRNYSQQVLPKDSQQNPPIQKLQFANHIQSLCTKGEHNFLQEKKNTQLKNNQVQGNLSSSQLMSKNARSLSNNHISQNTLQNNKKENLEIQTAERQLTFQGILKEQSERNLHFTKSPTQIQTRNNSKSFSQSVNGAAVAAASKERKVSFVAQSADFQEQNQILTKQSSVISQVDSKRSCQSDDMPSSSPLSPLSTQGLKTNKVNTKNGFIEIQEDNWLSIECQNGQLIFKISPDGKKIQIQKFQKSKYQKKDYDLENLPEKYEKLYNYAKVVCQTLKAKTPLVKIQNEKGTFMLMSNQPKQNYEVSLTSGFKVSHVIGTDIMTVKDKQNNEFIVNLIQQKLNLNFPAEVTLAVKVSLEQMSACLQKQNEKYLANFK